VFNVKNVLDPNPNLLGYVEAFPNVNSCLATFHSRDSILSFVCLSIFICFLLSKKLSTVSYNLLNAKDLFSESFSSNFNFFKSTLSLVFKFSEFIASLSLESLVFFTPTNSP